MQHMVKITEAVCVLISIFFFSCSVDKDSENGIMQLPISVNNQNTLFYSELFDSVSYLQLKTNGEPDSYVGHVSKMTVTDDKVFVFKADLTPKLNVFNREGEFLFTVAPPNEGPGNIVSGTDFVLGNDGTFEILDQGGAKILIYDQDGNFTSTVPLDNTTFFNLRKFSDGNYVLNTSSNIYDNQSNRIVRFDKLGNRIGEELPVDHNGPMVVIQKDWFSKVPQADQFLYTSVFNDTIYQIGPNDIDRKYRLNFGPYFFSKAELSPLSNLEGRELGQKVVNNPEKVIYIDKVQLTGRKIFIFYTIRGKRRMSVFDRDGRVDKHFSGKHKNDIDHGPSSSAPYTFYDGYFIYLTNGYYLNEHLRRLDIEDSASKHLNNKLENIDLESENPILIFAKLREAYR